MELTGDTLVFRVGGGAAENLRLKSTERRLQPPGISVVMAGSARELGDYIRRSLSQMTRLVEASAVMGRATVAAVREAGFDVIALPTSNFPAHARLPHPSGVAGFTDENLVLLARAFTDEPGV